MSREAIVLIIYLFALFFLGLGNAVVTYHILRYRDPDDASGAVLFVYFIIVFIIVIGTALLVNWQTIFPL